MYMYIIIIIWMIRIGGSLYVCADNDTNNSNKVNTWLICVRGWKQIKMEPITELSNSISSDIDIQDGPGRDSYNHDSCN